MTYRFPILLSALAACIVLAGCHSVKTLLPPNFRPPAENVDGRDQARQQLLRATPCCSSFADFSYQRMLPWQPEKFRLGSGGMVANLNGTHSYFLAFRLPEDAKLPYRVALKSELNGRWLHTSYLFAPTIVLLDAGFQPIQSRDIGLCEHMGWGEETTGAFGSLEIGSEKARYLLVYSSAAQQSGQTYWEQSPAAFTTNATLSMNSAGSFSVPHGPDGSLWVGMMNTTYAKAVDNAICKKAPEGNGVLSTLRTVLPTPWSTHDSGGGNSTSDEVSSP